MKLASFSILSSAIATAMLLVPIACGSQADDPTASDTQALDPLHFCYPPTLPPAETLTATVSCLGPTPSTKIIGEGFLHEACRGWIGGDTVNVAYVGLTAGGQPTGFAGTYEISSAAGSFEFPDGAPGQVGEIAVGPFAATDYPVATLLITASDVTTGVQANNGQTLIVTLPACP
jgi:hypothetical protein